MLHMLLEFAESELKYVGLYVANLLWKGGFDFSEGDKIPITDAASLLTLKQVLEETYTDGITAIKEVYLEGDRFTGIFEDKVSDKLTKRNRFTVSEDKVSYKLENPEDLENFSEFVLLEFAAKKAKNCVKGQSCGGSCISKNKECRKVPSAGATKKVTELKIKATSGSNSKSNKTDIPKTKATSGSNSKSNKTDVPKTTIGENGAKYYLTDVKEISGGKSYKGDKQVDHIARQIVESNGNLSTPIVIFQTGAEKYQVAKNPDNERLLAAARKAKELEPRKGEMVSTYVVKNQEEADAVLYQRGIAGKAGKETPRIGNGEFYLVDTKTIKGGNKPELSEEIIEKIAQSQLRVGNALPLVVRRTGDDEYEVVHGHEAIAAGRRAQQIDPMRGEMINAFVISGK